MAAKQCRLEFVLLTLKTMVILEIIPVALTDPEITLAGWGCSPNKYVNATAFKENLDAIVKSLSLNISTGFAMNSTEENGDTDPVFGLAQCISYLTSGDCVQCYTEAAKQIQSICSSCNGARIILDGCFFRYENSSFYADAVDLGHSCSCGSANDGNPQIFSRGAQTLLERLSNNASSSGNLYAVGSIPVSSSTTIYGVVQCWRTLSNGSCAECLQEALDLLKQSCFPSREGRAMEAGCFMRYATYAFFSDNLTSSSLNLPAPSSKSHSEILPILLGTIGGAALLTALSLLLIFRHAAKNFWPFIRLRKSHDAEIFWGAGEDLAARDNFEQVIFDYEVLRNATGNFGASNLIGEGGFGKVYKGNLPDGRQVAIKKLNGSQTSQAIAEFLTEAKLINSVRHRNLVRLYGCCMHGHERLLVYEFMSNSSLDRHLFGETRNPLNWETRFEIIVGTARGLAYLHEDSNVRIVHRDIKGGNILLDDKFHPKIADFGLARFFPEGDTHVSTRVGGTIGYTAPEYAVHGHLTEKADVYSWGVVVLEIVSGRKSMNSRLPADMQLLLEWAWRRYESEEALDIVDAKLEGAYRKEQVLRVITIALLCTQGSSAQRPAMSQVVSMLSSDSEIVVQPKQPAFIDVCSRQNPISATESTSSNEPSSQSHGSISMSLGPR